MKQQSTRGVWGIDIVKWAIILTGLLFIFIMLSYGFTQDGVRQLMRWSGKISFVFFCMAFGASSIHAVVQSSFSWWMSMNRKYLGISFAIIHLLHLLFVIILQFYFHPVFNKAAWSSLFGGSVAYFFVVTMLLTSFKSFSKYLSPRKWKTLHTFGGYWIGFIYLSTYLKRTDEPVYWVFVVTLILILVLRLKKKFASS